MEAVWTIDALISHGSQEQIQLVVKGNALPQLCRLLQSSNSQVSKLYYSGWVDVSEYQTNSLLIKPIAVYLQF